MADMFRYRIYLISLVMLMLLQVGHAQFVPSGAVGDGSSGASGSVLLSNEELFGESSADTATPAPAPAPVTTPAPAPAPSQPAPTAQPVEPAEPTPAAQTMAPVSTATAPSRLLIGRPSSFSYSVDQKSAWMAPLVEMTLTLALGAAPGVYVVAPDDVSKVIPQYRDYSTRISKQKLRESCRALGATHVLYIEYETVSARQARLHCTIAPAGQGEESRAKVDVDLENLPKALNTVAGDIARLAGLEPAALGQGAPAKTLGSADTKRLLKLGSALAWSGAADAQKATEAAAQCKAMIASDKAMALAGYCAAVMFAEADKGAQALEMQKKLIAWAGASYARLCLDAARYAELAGDHSEALSQAGKAPRGDAFTVAVAMVRARAYERAGRLQDARREYQSVTSVDNADAAALVRLCAIDVVLDKPDTEILAGAALAAQAAGSSTADVLCGVGTELQAQGQTTQALTAYLLCSQSAPENQDVLVKIARIHREQGDVDKAAQVYAGLAQMNPVAYRPMLDTAARMLVETGRRAQAMKAYEEYTAERDDLDATLKLAQLAFQSGDCVRVRALVKQLQARYFASASADSMMAVCSKDTVAPVITLRGGAMTLTTGETWVDPGAAASDDQDGDLSAFVKTESTVDIAYPGSYFVTYSVTDKGGNTSTVKRAIDVTGKARPELAAQAKSKQRRPVRVALSLTTGLLAAGALAAGIVLDNQIGTLQEQYDQSRDFDEVGRLHSDMEQTTSIRNALYAASGVCGAGFAVTITVPAIKKARVTSTIAMSGVSQ